MQVETGLQSLSVLRPKHCSTDHSVGNQRPFGNIVDGTFSPLLGPVGAPSRWESRLSMSLQQHEIGLGACPPRRPRNLVAGVPENCNIEFGLWKADTYSFRVGDRVECTMEKEVRRHKKINLALAIAEGESVNAWAQQNGVPERTAFR